MKHDPKATANALATVGAVLYAVCAGWVLVSRDGFMNFFSTWTHSVDLVVLPAKTPDVGSILWGLVTFTVASWLTGYLFAVAYNKFLKK